MFDKICDFILLKKQRFSRFTRFVSCTIVENDFDLLCFKIEDKRNEFVND